MRSATSVLVVFILALVLAGPVSAVAPGRCSISVAPTVGTTTDSYRVTATGFPPGSHEEFTDVRIDVRRAGGGRFGSVAFLTLAPEAGGSFYYDFHYSFPGEDPLPPLESGRYRVRAEANGNECVAIAAFIVSE